LIRKIIQATLGHFGYRMSQAKKGNVTGSNLWDDLSFLISQTIKNLSATFKAPMIHAFEPALETFEILSQKPYDAKVFLHHCALGKETGQREFINYESSCLSSFLTMEDAAENRFKDMPIKSKEQVAISRVDQFMIEHAIDQIDLLKIDTQGFEMDVLMGAKAAFEKKQVRYVLLEMNFIKMYQDQSASEQLTQFLKQHDFYLIDYYEKVRQNHTIAWSTALFGHR